MRKVNVDDNFGVILNCAVRYALGRRTYMPSLVVGYIVPLLGDLDVRTLATIKNDLTDRHACFGDETIDKPQWMRLLADVESEMKRRESYES